MSDPAAPAPWERNGEALEASFQFADFDAAFSFMTRVAAEAEQRNHHPEWFNVYGRVDIRLTTHDADGGSGGLTDADWSFARAISELAATT